MKAEYLKVYYEKVKNLEDRIKDQISKAGGGKDLSDQEINKFAREEVIADLIQEIQELSNKLEISDKSYRELEKLYLKSSNPTYKRYRN